MNYYTLVLAPFSFSHLFRFFFPFRIVFVLSWKSMGTRLERMVVGEIMDNRDYERGVV